MHAPRRHSWRHTEPEHALAGQSASQRKRIGGHLLVEPSLPEGLRARAPGHQAAPQLPTAQARCHPRQHGALQPRGHGAAQPRQPRTACTQRRWQREMR